MILSVTPSATTAEIAQATEINYHTVKKIVGRIRADMKRALVTAIDQSQENPPDAMKSEPLINSTTGAPAKPGSSAQGEGSCPSHK